LAACILKAKELSAMDIVQQIVNHVDQLPPSQQAQVLRFVEALSKSEPLGPGVPGSSLLKFFGTLDSVSAKEMSDAIETGCEQVDPSRW
jgi:hypothetical protein